MLDAGYSMLDKSKKTLRAFAPPNEEDRYERSEESQAQVDRESKYHSGILSRNEKKIFFCLYHAVKIMSHFGFLTRCSLKRFL